MQLRVTRYGGEGGRGGRPPSAGAAAAFFPSVIERAKPGLHSGRNGSRAHDEPVYDFAVSP